MNMKASPSIKARWEIQKLKCEKTPETTMDVRIVKILYFNNHHEYMSVSNLWTKYEIFFSFEDHCDIFNWSKYLYTFCVSTFSFFITSRIMEGNSIIISRILRTYKPFTKSYNWAEWINYTFLHSEKNVWIKYVSIIRMKRMRARCKWRKSFSVFLKERCWRIRWHI